MTIGRQTVFWLSALLLLLLFLTFLGNILLPFVLGAAIAYLLDPVADRLEEFGFSRLWATILIVFVFGLLLVVGFMIVLPLLAEQLVQLAGELPGALQQVRDLGFDFLKRWGGEDWLRRTMSPDGNFKQFADKAAGWAGNVLSSVWSGGLAVVNFLALFLVTPVVMFYLLLDWDRMISNVNRWLPRDHAGTIRRLAREMDDVISGFVRGQVTVLLILGVFYVIGLTLIGLNYGLLIGLGAGLISFIPFLGPFVGFVVGGSVAVLQFWPEWQMVAAVIGVFVAGQAIEGNILSPLIVGDRVRLHPVWLIFALFVFAYLFGFVGMLLAVPLAAAIGVLVRFALQVYLDSPLYLGESANARAPKRRNKRAPEKN